MSSSKRKRGRYKQYLDNPSCPIPKQTLSYWRKKSRLLIEQSTEQLDELEVNNTDPLHSSDSDDEWAMDGETVKDDELALRDGELESAGDGESASDGDSR